MSHTADAPAVDGDRSRVVAPIGSTDRIATLDILRGVAVLGILLMNIPGFAMQYAPFGNPLAHGNGGDANVATWAVINVGFSGTMRTIFSILFGAGVLLFIRRGGAETHAKRMMWLLLFGMAHAYLMLWVGDILFRYAVCGLLLVPFVRLAPRWLIVVALITIAVPHVRGAIDVHRFSQMHAAHAEAIALEDDAQRIPDEMQAQCEAWDGLLALHVDGPDDGFNEVEVRRSGYITNLTTFAPIVRDQQSKGLYEWDFWDAFPVMLLGMALLEWGVLSGTRSRRFYLVLMLAGYGVGLTTNAIECWWIVSHDYALMAIVQTWMTFDVGRIPTALGHIGLVMLAATGSTRRLLGPLAAAGRMALTNYLMQTVICVTLFYGVGFGLFERLERWQLYPIVAAIWIAQLIISPLWLRAFRFGPVEWLWRTLTYWQFQPMRIAPTKIREMPSATATR